MVTDYHARLDKSIAAARAEVKKRAKHFPNDFPEYGRWQAAVLNLKKAKQLEQDTRAIWDKIRK